MVLKGKVLDLEAEPLHIKLCWVPPRALSPSWTTSTTDKGLDNKGGGGGGLELTRVGGSLCFQSLQWGGSCYFKPQVGVGLSYFKPWTLPS